MGLYVDFDIETLGLTAEDAITCVGFRTPATDYSEPPAITILYNLSTAGVGDEIDGESTSALVAHIDLCVQGTAPIDSGVSIEAHEFNVILCDDEQTMLQRAMDELNTSVDEALSADATNKTPTLVGFNTDDFDIPLLRSRSCKTGVDWGLSEWGSLDIMYAFQHQINTKVRSADIDTLNKKPKRQFGEYIGAAVDGDMYVSELDEAIEAEGYTDEEFIAFLEANDMEVPITTQSSLDDIFALIVGVDVPDPFDESDEAIDAHKNGDIEDVILHNVVDIWQSYALRRIAERYGNLSEITTRSL